MVSSYISSDFNAHRKLYIVDARPRANALANGAKGGGSESASNYPRSEVLFLGIQNIHTMRDSLFRLRDYVDTHGSVSSNGTSSAVSLVGDRVSLWFVLLNYHLQYTFP
jgi:myotubularin-related protein 1/2